MIDDDDSGLLFMQDRLTYCASYLEAKTEQQRLQDMCEDAGLVFCLPSLNPYSQE